MQNSRLKVVCDELYRGIWPDTIETETHFLSLRQMPESNFLKEEAEVLVTRPYVLKENILIRCKRLRWIQTPAAGLDEIDLKYITQNNILLTNGSGNMSISLAEDIFCKMLRHSRRVREYEAAQAERRWETFGQHPWMSVISNDLYGKKLGLIGDGAIAYEVAKRAVCFGMDVCCYGIHKERSMFEHYYNTPEGFEKIIRESDFLVLALPLVENTYHLFNKKIFSMMKTDAMFLNSSRGGLVSEADLVEALENKIISAAGLDVFETEPLPQSSKLWGMSNVYITAHNAGAGDSWLIKLRELFSFNLEAYLKGGTLKNIVRNK